MGYHDKTFGAPYPAKQPEPTPDPSTPLIGLLQCRDGTAFIIGKPHREAEKDMMLTPCPDVSNVRLDRIAAQRLRDMLDDYLSEPKP